MLVLPQPETAFLDPFCQESTLTIICNIQDPLTKEDYSRDPRTARKASTHEIDRHRRNCLFAQPELEFFVFDNVRFDQDHNSGYYFLDSIEGAWNAGRDGAEPWLQDPLQGRLLPHAAQRLAARHPHRDDDADDSVRHPHRGAAS